MWNRIFHIENMNLWEHIAYEKVTLIPQPSYENLKCNFIFQYCNYSFHQCFVWVFFRGEWFEHVHQNIDCAWLLVIFKLHVFSWQPQPPVFSSILFCLSTSTDWKPWIKYLEQEILPFNRMNLLLCCAKESLHHSPWTGASHSKTL